uniref:Uncharacterized protein n=1 Tax=Rhizophora mucronata TaxID=61149 RepID=A0A2P2MXC5_RHIMU
MPRSFTLGHQGHIKLRQCNCIIHIKEDNSYQWCLIRCQWFTVKLRGRDLGFLV